MTEAYEVIDIAINEFLLLMFLFLFLFLGCLHRFNVIFHFSM